MLTMTLAENNISQAEQGRQLLKMSEMIRQTCPAGLQAEVFPLLDQLESGQKKLDEILAQMTDNPLIASTEEEVEALADKNRQLYAEHTAIAKQMQAIMGKVLALVKK